MPMSKQIQCVSASPCGKCDVFFFPWAGGNQSSLNPLYKALSKESVNAYCVNYAISSPHKRYHVTSDLVNLLVEEFASWLSNRSCEPPIPIVFFGYSYGGLIAYEVSAALVGLMHMNVVHKLVLCAIASPQFLTVKNQSEQGLVHKYNDAQLTRHIIDIGGLPTGIDPVFLQAALPAIRADYTAFETYTVSDSTLPRQVQSRLHVFYCLEDEYTPSTESVQGWRDTTSGECEIVMVEQGSHFVFMENTKMQMIVDALLL